MTSVLASIHQQTRRLGHGRVGMVMCRVGKPGPDGWVIAGGFN